MELSAAASRAVEAEALNFGADNGNLIFLHRDSVAQRYFWSVVHHAQAVGCAWTFWRTVGQVGTVFWLMMDFTVRKAVVTMPEDGWTSEFSAAMRACFDGPLDNARLFRRAFRALRIAGHDRMQRWPDPRSHVRDTLAEHEAYIRERIGTLPPYALPQVAAPAPATLRPRVTLRPRRDRSRSR